MLLSVEDITFCLCVFGNIVHSIPSTGMTCDHKGSKTQREQREVSVHVLFGVSSCQLSSDDVRVNQKLTPKRDQLSFFVVMLVLSL